LNKEYIWQLNSENFDKMENL